MVSCSFVQLCYVMTPCFFLFGASSHPYTPLSFWRNDFSTCFLVPSTVYTYAIGKKKTMLNKSYSVIIDPSMEYYFGKDHFPFAVLAVVVYSNVFFHNSTGSIYYYSCILARVSKTSWIRLGGTHQLYVRLWMFFKDTIKMEQTEQRTIAIFLGLSFIFLTFILTQSLSFVPITSICIVLYLSIHLIF